MKKKESTESESVPSSTVVVPTILLSRNETMVVETIDKAPQDNFKSERKHKKYRYFSSKSKKHTHRNMLLFSLSLSLSASCNTYLRFSLSPLLVIHILDFLSPSQHRKKEKKRRASRVFVCIFISSN
jgi:hypothetical protein